ncbi:hypothetical protein DFH28DRAFT_1130728 [Melampsora americana]|nr:hypothetical protein DFH28DRAFT_1130728 [Melampsora americana]
MSAQSTPRVNARSRSEVIWLGNDFRGGMSPQQYIRFRGLPDNGDRTHAGHLSPRGERAQRRNEQRMTPDAPVRRRHTQNVSPQALRQKERLDEYNRIRQSKESIRRIIKVIQDKRRDDFLVLCTALCEVFYYNGPYLQKPGEKEAAADLLRVGTLGAEFVNEFDSKAKWQWLQMRVDDL